MIFLTGETTTMNTGMGVMRVGVNDNYCEFEDLNKTLQQLNDRLKEEPIPGNALCKSFCFFWVLLFLLLKK